MGDARRRKAEIEELKKKPRERKRKKRLLGKAKTESVLHFNKAAARAKADPHYEIGRRCRETVTMADAVRLGAISPELIHPVELKIMTPVEIEPTRQPRQPLPLAFAVGKKSKADAADYAIAMAQINPRGFRQPSTKAKNWQSTSLLEKLSILAGWTKPSKFERSERGQKKLQARNETNALIVLERLIEQHPQRAAQAKTDERMLNWFVASVEEDHDIDREWLRLEAKTRLNGRHSKFRHAAERRRAKQKVSEAA